MGSCVDDYKSAVKLEETGQLIPARERFVRCSKAACGSPLREECTTRFTQLDTEIPSVVPIATDADGQPRFDVEVKMDGQVLTDKLDGHSWPLNPGRHEIQFSADGQVFSTQELLVIQGQRNRPVQATVGGEAKPTRAPVKTARKPAPAVAVTPAADTEEATPSAPPPQKKVRELPRPEVAAKQIAEKEEEEKENNGPEVTLATDSKEGGSSAMPYVLGAAGLASIGTGVAFIYWGRKDNNALANCSSDVTNCPQAAVDHVHRMYLIGNVALGVGVAALGAAYWLHARSGSSGKESQSEEAYRFDVAPTNSGAVASVSGSF